MRRKFLLIIFLRLVICRDESAVMLFKIVKAITESHYFSFYVILDSDNYDADDYLFNELVKTVNSGYTMVAHVTMEKYENYVENIDDTRRTRCLKIINARHKINRDLFAELTNHIDISDNDVYLLFLDDETDLENYLKTLVLPFDVQVLVAYVKHSKDVDFIAPYRVAPDFPLRMPKVGTWSEFSGLDLPHAGVALTRRDLEGLAFKTGTLDYPPVTTVRYTKAGKLTIEGYFADIWKELGTRLNFTSVYSLSPDGATGAFNRDGKTWSGLMGMLTRDEIDVAVSEFTITEARSHFVDFSIPMMTTGLQVFFSQSGDHLEWGSIFRPFRAETWLVIVAWFIVAAIALSVFYTLGCRYDLENFVYKQEYTIFGSFFIVFKAFTAQGSDLVPQSRPGRILFSCSYLMMGIILPSYSAALISYLTVHTPVRPFTSLENMLQVKTHKLLVAKKTAEYAFFSDANDPLLKRVYEELIKPLKESELPAHTQQGIEAVCKKRNRAFFGLYLSGKVFVDKLYLEKGCKIMTFDTPVSYADATIAFRKGSPYSLVINSEVQRMVFEGILRRIEKRTWPLYKNFQNLNFEAIEIHHVIQLHILLLSGYLFATFFVILETFTAKKRRKNMKKRFRIIQAFPIYQRFYFE